MTLVDVPEEKDPVSDISDEKNIVNEDVVLINVSGSTFELEIDDLRQAPSSKLFKYAFNGKSLQFKRPISSFEAVLAYYQTGELHMPLSVCPGAFKTELEFWGLDPQIMMKCCYYRLLSHQDDQETLDRFHAHLFPDTNVEKNTRCLSGLRNYLWNVLDFQEQNYITKIYFSICTLMVIVSVLTLALSSLPVFRRNLTKCELEEYMGKSVEDMQGALQNSSCEAPLNDDVYGSVIVDYERVYVKNITDIKDMDKLVIHDSPMTSLTPSTTTGSMIDRSSPTLNLSQPNLRNFFDFNSESDVSDHFMLNHLVEVLRPKIGISKRTVRIEAIVYLDTIALAFFTIDLLGRVLCCPSIKHYFLSTINLFDAIAVLAAYAHMTVNLLWINERYESTNYDILEIFQVLRVVRLLRIVRDVIGFKVLSFSLRVSIKDLLVLFLYMVLGVVIFANFIFFVESESEIESIPTGWWWAISTLTTVGYGDVKPRSFYGRCIGGVCAISGVVMMAVAIPVFVKTFLLLYAYAVLYKKTLHRPEDTHRYIHRQGRLKANAAMIDHHVKQKC